MEHPKWILDDVVQSEASWANAHSVLPVLLKSFIPEINLGVEVGVAYGSMSISLLDKIPNFYLYAVDPYIPYDLEDVMSRTIKEQDELFAYTNMRLNEKHPTRSKLLREPSVIAAKQFKDDELDFVFIDACHQYEAVKEDIAIWEPKVRKGGVVCGHDYRTGWVGVTKAVNEYAENNKKQIIYNAESSIWAILKS